MPFLSDGKCKERPRMMQPFSTQKNLSSGRTSRCGEFASLSALVDSLRTDKPTWNSSTYWLTWRNIDLWIESSPFPFRIRISGELQLLCKPLSMSRWLGTGLPPLTSQKLKVQNWTGTPPFSFHLIGQRDLGHKFRDQHAVSLRKMELLERTLDSGHAREQEVVIQSFSVKTNPSSLPEPLSTGYWKFRC